MQSVSDTLTLGKSWEESQTPLSKEILSIIHDDFKFKRMSPVQENAIPLFLSHKDIVAEACTGSGKTLAYLIPIFEIILRREERSTFEEILAIVICPTRELAKQVFDQANVFVKRFDFVKTMLVTGGTSLEENGTGNEIVAICTPGRLLAFLDSQQRKTKSNSLVKNLEILVLDEADRILSLGFEMQINQILQKLPKQRRTGLFSATQTNEMKDLIRSGLRNPVMVQVEVMMKNKQATPKGLTNHYMVCPQNERFSQLVNFLLENHDQKIIVYYLTCACVNFHMKLLKEVLAELGKKNETASKIQIYGLHGKMVQKRRTATYNDYLQAKSGVLVCTDVAARGLDFPDINFIVQFDPPQDPAVFVHRVGRTARMGKKGASIVFLSHHERAYVEFLKVKKVPIEEMEKPEVEDLHSIAMDVVKKDRDLVEKGTEAFVSFVRGYKEHQCNYIFKLKELEFDKLAQCYCLVQQPKLWRREFKTIQLNLEEFDVDSIPYKDTRREKARQARIEKEKQEKEALEKQKLEEKEEREQNQQEQQKKMKSLHKQKEEIRHAKDLKSKNKRRAYKNLEEDELKYEALLLKKLKQGKISNEEYERLTGEADYDLDGGFEGKAASAGASDDDDDDKPVKQPKKKRKHNRVK